MARIEQLTSPILLKEPLSPETANELLFRIATNKANITLFRKDENGELIKQTHNPSELLHNEDKETFEEVFSELQKPTIKIIYRQKIKVFS